jgi:DNA segregation ATPase FtsK/SpoIIIE-like protein
MPDIFDRLGSFLKSIFSEDETDDSGQRQYYDEDMQNAWDELEDYLDGGKDGSRAQASRQDQSRSREKAAAAAVREKLREDYANLKVPFGAPFEEVKTAYKKLLRQYHPDKHASDPQKFKLATEITSKLNQSYQKIEEYENNRKK